MTVQKLSVVSQGVFFRHNMLIINSHKKQVSNSGFIINLRIHVS